VTIFITSRTICNKAQSMYLCTVQLGALTQHSGRGSGGSPPSERGIRVLPLDRNSSALLWGS